MLDLEIDELLNRNTQLFRDKKEVGNAGVYFTGFYPVYLAQLNTTIMSKLLL